MINYSVIESILHKMNDDIDVLAILDNQVAPKPSYPFITYKFLVPYIPQATKPIVDKKLIANTTDIRFDYDFEYTQQEQPTLSVSINIYSNDELEALEVAYKVKDWFRFEAYEYFNSKNIVIVETTAIQNRDTLIVNDQERRKGIDIILRVTDEAVRIIETIEEVEL